MLITEGEILKQWVKSKGFSGKEVANMLGLTSRQAVYEVYKSKVLLNKHKESLKDKGFSVDNVKNMSNDRKEIQDISQYEEYIAALKDISDLQKEKIAQLEGELRECRVKMASLTTKQPAKPKQPK